jgi:hypothetical protein
VFTSRVVSWKRSIIGSTVVFGIALVLAAGRSNNVPIPVPAGRTLPKDFDAPLPVRRIIQRACLDCHSEQTIWPWYSNIPPISRQIHDDVNNGREFMDFSHWSEYTTEEQTSYASLIAGATSARVMPPPKYLWMHRDARLSSADLDMLKKWAHSRPKSGFPKQ